MMLVDVVTRATLMFGSSGRLHSLSFSNWVKSFLHHARVPRSQYDWDDCVCHGNDGFENNTNMHDVHVYIGSGYVEYRTMLVTRLPLSSSRTFPRAALGRRTSNPLEVSSSKCNACWCVNVPDHNHNQDHNHNHEPDPNTYVVQCMYIYIYIYIHVCK